MIVIARDIQRNDAVGNFSRQIAALLQGAGYEVRLAAENCHPDDRAAIARMPDAIATIAADETVFFQFSTEDPSFPAVAALPNPKIVYFHNITPERFFRGSDDRTADLVRQGFAQRPLCGRFDVVMANSRASAAALVESLVPDQAAGLDAAQIVICPPVVGIDRWTAIEAAEPASQPDGRLVLFVGRLVPHKGIDDLIDGFAELARRDGATRLAIVGGPPQSAYALALKQRAAALGPAIANRIAFHHDVSEAELKRLYREADIYASISRHEGFGVPLIDAMVFGKPLVINAEPGMLEIADGAAIVLRGISPRSIATALDTALNDGSARARMAEHRTDRLAFFRNAADGHLIIEAIERSLNRR